jgi:branched-chain amino acid transport system ATP-binding protein
MLLEAPGVTTRFGGLTAVDDVSFSLEAGEVLGLIGPNGAGKTTLFNTVAGFLRPSGGRVLLNGEDISGMPPHKIAARGIARTFQLSRPFGELTVMENVLVGAWLRTRSREQAHESAEAALERVRFAHRAKVPAHDLTAAERKRLDLARCLATQPSVLLVDEVIAGCNEQEMEQILETLRELRAQGVAIVMVEHVLRAVMAVCDRIMVLAGGRVAARGTPEEIRTDARAIEVYLGTEEPGG